jgi:hypothetical protein
MDVLGSEPAEQHEEQDWILHGVASPGALQFRMQ